MSAPAPLKKKRKTETASGSRNVPSQVKFEKVGTPLHNSSIPVMPVTRIDLKILQDKKNAVTQAKLEGCLGNYKSFNSPFGNYLVPVVPTHADLSG